MITDELHQLRRVRARVANESDSQGEEIYVIDPKLCTECVGHYDKPQCQEVCPIDCIPFNPDVRETKDELYQKYLKISAAANK